MDSFWQEYRKVALVAGGILLAIGLLVYAIVYRGETQAQATRFTWMRAINIERWQTVEDSDWYIPPTGRKTREYQAIHHWERYVSGSHEECSTSGTGTSARVSCTTELDYSSRPVWATRYDYLIDRWVVIKTPTLQGEGQDPVWPDVSDIREAHNPPLIGDERPAMRISRYTLELATQDGKHYSLDLTEDRWHSFRPGVACTVILDIFGRALDVRNFLV